METSEKTKESERSNERNTKSNENSDEVWATLIMIFLFCVTIVWVTRMWTDATLETALIQHYSMRGASVIYENDELVFVNNKEEQPQPPF